MESMGLELYFTLRNERESERPMRARGFKYLL